MPDEACKEERVIGTKIDVKLRKLREDASRNKNYVVKLCVDLLGFDETEKEVKSEERSKVRGSLREWEKIIDVALDHLGDANEGLRSIIHQLGLDRADPRKNKPKFNL